MCTERRTESGPTPTPHDNKHIRTGNTKTTIKGVNLENTCVHKYTKPQFMGNFTGWTDHKY